MGKVHPKRRLPWPDVFPAVFGTLVVLAADILILVSHAQTSGDGMRDPIDDEASLLAVNEAADPDTLVEAPAAELLLTANDLGGRWRDAGNGPIESDAAGLRDAAWQALEGRGLAQLLGGRPVATFNLTAWTFASAEAATTFYDAQFKWRGDHRTPRPLPYGDTSVLWASDSHHLTILVRYGNVFWSLDAETSNQANRWTDALESLVPRLVTLAHDHET